VAGGGYGENIHSYKNGKMGLVKTVLKMGEEG
jgi:hypothetical protein